MTIPDDNFQVRNPEAEKQLVDLGNLLRNHMPPNYGFALLLISFAPGANTFYTSNIDRADITRILRELITKFET